jgi:molybdenum cofactor synthesis domain-containing protein
VIRIAILTVSDGVAAGTRDDAAGAAAVGWVSTNGWALAEHTTVADERSLITAALVAWVERGDVNLILTLGGTGFGPRDVTPEATLPILERPAPGIAEALRAAGRESTAWASLSRGVAGIRGATLIVNLPGSETAVREGLAVLQSIVPHAVELLDGRTEHL